MNPPSSIAHYRITSKLGEGGMGAVYRATDTKLNRDVAVKILPDTFAADPDRLARFTREAQVLASLNHPHIAAIYGVEERALILELVEGDTLAERIAAGPIPAEEAVLIARQIAEALEYAHERGIIHRDLKPANVKLTLDGTVKVLDFGLAKALSNDMLSADPAFSPTLTMRATLAGTIIGTAAYMSPEQARGKPADRRSDIWAFGCVLLELLTGRRTFRGETTSDILAAVLKEPPDLSGLPPRLRSVIEKCLRRDPRMRWQAIGDVRIALEEAPSAGAPIEKAPPPRRSRVAWTVAALATALAAAFAFVHLRETPPRAEVVRFQILPPDKSSFGPAFSLSPDGRKLVFTAVAADGHSYIWLRPLNELEAKPLPYSEGANFLPFWSPDSRYLVFGSAGKLKKIEAAGGPVQVICDAPQVVIGGSWSPTGAILFGSNDGALLQVPAAGGKSTPITQLGKQETYHSHPFFLPDGRHFLYSRISQRADATGIFIGTTDAKPDQQPLKRLLAAAFAIYAPGAEREHGMILFLRDRALMAQPFDAGKLALEGEAAPVADPVGQYVSRGLFSASASGTLAYQAGNGIATRLTWYDRSGIRLGEDMEPGVYRVPVISRDGTRLAVRKTDMQTGNADIWIFDLKRGGSTRFTFDPGLDTLPAWSPDGTQIAFISNRSGAQDLYHKPASMDQPEEVLFHSNANKALYDWSPDGRYLIYTNSSSDKPGYDLWLLADPGKSGSPHEVSPFLEGEGRKVQAQFSPDGRWVAYTSDASSRFEVYVRPFPSSKLGAGQWMISTAGGNQPRWNRNGKELFYFSGRKLMSVEISTNPAFHAGTPKVLFEAPIYGGGEILSNHDWDVTPDGQRFLIVCEPQDRSATPITVVLNWLEGLRK